jgi:hypothetical protein
MSNHLIRSNNRTFFCEPTTGRNIGGTRYGNHVIQHFNLLEYISHHGRYLPREIDIIDIGYWYTLHDAPMAGTFYEPPVWHTREAVAA